MDGGWNDKNEGLQSINWEEAVETPDHSFPQKKDK